MVQLKVGASIFNKRARASTANDAPSLPASHSSSAYSPKGPDEMMPDIELKLQFAAQKHVNMCGDACVNMLYAYHGKTPPVNLKINDRGVFGGLDTDDVVEKFGTAKGGALNTWRPGWRSPNANFDGLTPMRLAAGLFHNGPLMMSGDFARFMGARWGHWIVVHGVKFETVLIADPWHGQDRKKPFSWLMKHISKDPDDRIFYIHASAPL